MSDARISVAQALCPISSDTLRLIPELELSVGIHNFPADASGLFRRDVVAFNYDLRRNSP